MEHLQLSAICEHLTQIEEPCEGLFDLILESQVQFLEYMKRYKDIERGKTKGRGFGNCWKLNSKRHPHVFTFLESEFHNLAKDFNLELNHEVRIKVNDRLNRSHLFKLDFLDPITRIDIEISPNWHKNYLLVVRRDALRRRLLKRVGIRSLTVPVTYKGKHGHIDYIRARRIIKIIKSATVSPNSLDYYTTNKEVNE
jgi:hypothetical protein